MARISRSTLTKLQIIQVACKHFLEDGYTATSAKTICTELDMSPGNLTFYFPTKEHLLAELIDLLCRFQWKMMEREADDGYSSVMAVCLELMAMAAVCEEDSAARDMYFSAYTSSLCLDILRRNDTDRAKEVFAAYRPEWKDEQFAEAELLVSGIEYATLTATKGTVPLETRIAGALNQILSIYGVPAEVREMKIARVLKMDYRTISRRILAEFKGYVYEANEQALIDLLKR